LAFAVATGTDLHDGWLLTLSQNGYCADGISFSPQFLPQFTGFFLSTLSAAVFHNFTYKWIMNVDINNNY
jgi:hypothetical protein